MEQQYSRPQRPTPPSRAASSRTPICRSSMRVRKALASSRTRARKSTRCSAVKKTVSLCRSHCHSASLTFISSLCSRTSATMRWRIVFLGAAQLVGLADLVLRGAAQHGGNSLGSSARSSRRPRPRPAVARLRRAARTAALLRGDVADGGDAPEILAPVGRPR